MYFLVHWETEEGSILFHYESRKCKRLPQGLLAVGGQPSRGTAESWGQVPAEWPHRKEGATEGTGRRDYMKEYNLHGHGTTCLCISEKKSLRRKEAWVPQSWRTGRAPGLSSDSCLVKPFVLGQVPVNQDDF